jgi:hypothetical protein
MSEFAGRDAAPIFPEKNPVTTQSQPVSLGQGDQGKVGTQKGVQALQDLRARAREPGLRILQKQRVTCASAPESGPCLIFVKTRYTQGCWNSKSVYSIFP